MRRFVFLRTISSAALFLYLMLSICSRPANAAVGSATPHAGEIYANEGAACSLPEVLQGAATRAKELLASVERFAAKDWLQEQIVDGAGFRRGFTATYDYVAYIEHQAPDQLVI